jgi:hypothetical protein
MDRVWSLHCSLLAGEPAAPDSFAGAILETLAADVARQFHTVSEDIITQAAIDAVWDHLQNPSKCRATTGSGIIAYIRGMAHKKVLDELRRERRRHAREESWARENLDIIETDVELLGLATTTTNAHEIEDLSAFRTSVLNLLTSETDRQLFQLRLSGERNTAAFAKVLGLDHLPIVDQRRIVKQNKDRIDKIIRRGIR